MSLHRNVILVTLLAVAFALGAGGTLALGARHVAAINEASTFAHLQLELADEAQRAVDTCDQIVRRHALYDDVSGRCAAAEKAFVELARSASDDPSADADVVDVAGEEDEDDELAHIGDGLLPALRAAAAGHTPDLAERFDAPAFLAARAALNDYERMERSDVAATERRAQAALGRMVWVGVLAPFVAASFFIVAAVWLARRLIRGFRALAEATRRIAEGDFDARLDARPGDEFGDAALAFEQMTSELRAAHSAADDAQRQARDLAHEAGKAEIAAGVLHNIGNALNGLTVSTSLLRQTLGATRASRLRDATTRLRDRDQELGGRVSADPTSAKLLAYLDALGKRWIEEIEGTTTRTAEIEAAVEHMRAVVSKQQAHARKVAAVEACSAMQIIDHARSFVASTFARQGIELAVQCDDAAEVLLDRHRAVQIVTNLLANARDALADARGPRRVTLSAVRDDHDLQLSVRDNGSGIAVENREKLFRYGFTTKRDGHGFGLHNGALLAQEGGGSLRYEPADGGGSIFTLTLPFKRIARREGPARRDSMTQLARISALPAEPAA